jgi:dTDP-4-amino-4,6-dideoxygalactose transaminase
MHRSRRASGTKTDHAEANHRELPVSIAEVPVNSLLRHIEPLREQLSKAATDVIASGHFVLGAEVRSFEQAFAQYCGVAHCIGMANGTDALELALRAVGVGPDSQVAVIANAAMYGTTAVLACGAAPVFVDVEAATGLIDPQHFSRLAAANPALRFVIVTHLFGRLADVSAIAETCAAHGIVMIEDCAQAHGATHRDGGRAGSFGAVACFSFYPTKNLGALGDGGAVVTQSAELAERLRSLRQYGWRGKYDNLLPGGRNSRLDELQAKLLGLMLPYLDGWNERRRAIANRYSAQIRHADIQVPAVSGAEYVAHLYVVRSSRRAELREHLRSCGVQTDVHYPVPDHRQACHAGRYAKVFLPVTEQLAGESLTLPCFPELSDGEAQQVIDACNRF